MLPTIKTMKMKPLLGACLVLLGLSQGKGVAQSVPSNYQGKLTDFAGISSPTGTYGLAVRIWSDPTNSALTTLVWGQEYTGVAVFNGVFNLILGSPGGTPANDAPTNSIDSAFNDPNRYIGLTVTRGTNGLPISKGEILPRQQIRSTPYALQAKFASAAQTVVTPPVPRGVIVMWSGRIALMPDGWVLCENKNQNPDLQNRFVIDANDDTKLQATTTYTGPATISGGSVHHAHSGRTGFSADWYDPKDGRTDRYLNSYGGNPNIDHDHPFTTDRENDVSVQSYALAFIMKTRWHPIN